MDSSKQDERSARAPGLPANEQKEGEEEGMIGHR
jgi:hypothetical protein